MYPLATQNIPRGEAVRWGKNGTQGGLYIGKGHKGHRNKKIKETPPPASIVTISDAGREISKKGLPPRSSPTREDMINYGPKQTFGDISL